MTPALLQKIIDEACRNQDWNDGSEAIIAQVSALHEVLDLDRLIELTGGNSPRGAVAITFASREYLELAVEWSRAVRSSGVSRFVIICGDSFSYERLAANGIRAIQARLDASALPPNFRSHDGFNAIGLGLTALKFTVASALVSAGFDVAVSDIDAIWCRDPYPCFPSDVDFAFQRVVLFPPAVVQLWGFSICSGFLYFRNSPATRSFLQSCIGWNIRVQSDQIAVNLALVSAGMSWNFPEGYHREHPVRQKVAEPQFKAFAGESFRGVSAIHGLTAMALAHNRFWRHPFVEPSNMVICHPNSAKSQSDKLKLLRKWLPRTAS